MKNHSIILKSFRLALICGATLVPLSDVHAGWNKLVDNLEGVTDEHIQPLKQLRDTKLAEDSSDSKWARRSRQLELLKSCPITKLDRLKEHLGDRRAVKDFRNDKVIHGAAKGARLVRRVAEEGADVGLLRTAFENNKVGQGLEVEKKHIPASTLINHKVTNVAAQIQSLEEFLPLMEASREKSTYTALLNKLKIAQREGITEYTSEEELTKRLPQYAEDAVLEESNSSPMPAVAPMTRIAAINVDEEIQILNLNLQLGVTDREARIIRAKLEKLEKAKRLGITEYVNDEELSRLLPSETFSSEPVRLSSGPHVLDVVESSAFNVAEELATNRMLLSVAESKREESMIKAKIKMLEEAQGRGIAQYPSEDALRVMLLQANSEVVEEVAPAINNVPQADPAPLPDQQPEVFNVAELIVRAQHDHDVTYANDPDMRPQTIQLRELMEEAQRLGIVTFTDADDLNRQMEERLN